MTFSIDLIGDYLGSSIQENNIEGSFEGNVLIGTAQSNIFIGTAQDDVLTGTPQSDIIFGNAGNDIIFGNAGDDIIFGNAGDDIIFGNAGDGIIFDDAGNDDLIGGYGDDILTGGEGYDRFFLYYSSGGKDTITDFTLREDTIILRSVDGESTQYFNDQGGLYDSDLFRQLNAFEEPLIYEVSNLSYDASKRTLSYSGNEIALLPSLPDWVDLMMLIPDIVGFDSPPVYSSYM